MDSDKMRSNSLNRLTEIIIAIISGFITYIISMIPVFAISVFTAMTIGNMTKLSGESKLFYKDVLEQIFTQSHGMTVSEKILTFLFYGSAFHTSNMPAIVGNDFSIPKDIITKVAEESFFASVISYIIFSSFGFIIMIAAISIFDYIFSSRHKEQEGVFSTTTIATYILTYIFVYLYTFIFVTKGFAFFPLLFLIPIATVVSLFIIIGKIRG